MGGITVMRGRIRHAKCGIPKVRITFAAPDTSLPKACSPNTSQQSIQVSPWGGAMGGITVMRGADSTCKVWYSQCEDDIRATRHVYPVRRMVNEY